MISVNTYVCTRLVLTTLTSLNFTRNNFLSSPPSVLTFSLSLPGFFLFSLHQLKISSPRQRSVRRNFFLPQFPWRRRSTPCVWIKPLSSALSILEHTPHTHTLISQLYKVNRSLLHTITCRNALSK